jgi:hypothetical protein
MKSIKQQYIDLMEGRMSQHNFMRSLRMTMPQYVTNVTSFKDSVRILKNKGILSEAMGGDPIEATLKSYLAKGNSYAEAIELTAAEQSIDEEVLMSQYPQDAVDTEGYEDEGDDEEFIDMIAKAKEEEAGKYTKFDDFEGGLSEKAHDGLKIEWDWDNADVDYDTDEEGNEGAFGTVFGRDEKDHAYSARFDAPVSGGDIDFDSADVSSIKKTEDASELYERSYKVSPNAISVSSLKKGDVLGGSGLEVINISAGARTPSGKIEVTVKDPKTGNEVTKVWNKATKVTVKKDLNEGKKKKEPKKELHPNQIHPQELRMGIKVELEHTDSLDKAKKIALDHLAENPFYYTALKLAGVESPSTPKYKAPVAFKKEVTVAVELVDKENAMKPVKGFEKAKASSNKAKKETNSGVKGVSELTHNAKSVRGLQKFAATGGKMKTVKEGQLNEGGEYMFSGTLTGQETADLKKMIPGVEIEEEELDDTYKTVISHPTYNEKTLRHAIRQVMGQLSSTGDKKDLGASFDKLKSQLESIVREVLDEMYDGRDDMNAENKY